MEHWVYACTRCENVHYEAARPEKCAACGHTDIDEVDFEDVR